MPGGEVGMYRERIHIKVASTEQSAWNGVISLHEEFNALARSRGWTEGVIWTQTFGPFGEIVIELEYDDLATYEREQKAMFADPEAAKLVERITEHLDPSFGGNELWQRAESVGP
jgi:hypothetical protein